MRWHVYGTDAGTGQDVVLALDEQEATHAVQTAIAKRILVSHVTREAGEGLRRRLLPLACAAVVVLVPLCIALYAQHASIRARLTQAVSEQKRLAQIAAQAESLASQIRQGASLTSATSPTGRDETAEQMAQLIEQLASARTRATQSEEQLNTTFAHLSKLERTANQVPLLQARLKSETEALQQSAAELLRLTQENALQRRRLDELAALPAIPGPVAKKLAHLESSNKELSAQVDLLKSQLLVAAATSTAQAAPEPDAVPTPAGPTRWAMRASYDAAADFLRLHFDKDTVRTVPTDDGAVAASGVRIASAATLRLVHDRAKERVYSGTLTVPLAPEGPKEKLAENVALAADFLRTFAPSCEKPEATITAAVAQLAGRGGGASGPRWVVVGADYKLTVWHQGNGAYALRTESPRVDFED